MAEVNHRSDNVQHSSGSEENASEDNKRRIRKMIEVTRSTRYTTFVEGDDGTNNPRLVQSSSRTDFFTTSMTVVDSSLGNLQEAVDDTGKFAAKCHDKAGQYTERLQKIDEKVEECAKTAEKHQHLKAKVLGKRGAIKEKLQGVLEVSRKKRANREKILGSLIKKMC